MTPEGRRFHAFVSRSLVDLRKGEPMMPEREAPRPLKAPVELAALKSRLLRAKGLQARIADEGRRVDDVLDSIEERLGQVTGHRGDLERYNDELGTVINGMLDGSNRPNGGGSPEGGERSEPEKTDKAT